MIYRILGGIFLLIVLCGLNSDFAMAQAYRNAVHVPPTEVYQSMLNFVDRKEYAKIMGPLNILSPITSHITAKFTGNPADGIKKAIDQGNPDEILLSVQILILLDIKDLLDEAAQNVDPAPDVAKAHVNAARLDYELLSSYVREKDFAADQKTRKNFTDSLRALGSESLYSTEKAKVNTQQLKQRWTEIVFNLSRIFTSKVF